MKKDIRTLAALLMAGAAFTACSDKDEMIGEQTVNPVTKYTMTVNATKGDDGTTRALDLSGTALKVKWAGTDQVAVFPEAWSRTPLGTLTAVASETGTTTLSGDLTGSVHVNDNLHLLFPRAEWDYTGQKGILLDDENSIEKKYDYAQADVTVAAIDNSHITTTANANLASQQAIVKFTLQDKDGNAINATSLNISASSNKLVKNKSYRGAGTKTYYYGSGYYTVTAGSGGNTNEQHGNLVDNNLSTKWCQDKPGGGWYIEFHTASPIQVDGYMLRTGDDTGRWGQWTRNPQDWVLKGKKNSGDSWTVIDTKSNNNDMPNADNAEKDFDVDIPGEYQYFRLEISNNRGNGGAMQLSEMRLFSYEYFEMGTTYGGLTVTPASATSELTVALRNENDGADTYTLTATVGGATYNYTKSGVTFENGKYYAITVKMNPKKVSSIYLNKTSASLAIGGTVELSVSSVSPSDAVDKTVTWSSSNTSVATVNASTGVVTAKAEGTATITATANDGSGKTATCSVTVYPAGTVVWDPSNWGNQYYDNSHPCSIDGITLTMSNYAKFKTSTTYADLQCQDPETGNYTFTAPAGKVFTKIEINSNDHSGWEYNNPMTSNGWAITGSYMTNYKATWTGNASTVSMFNGNNKFDFMPVVYSIIFIVE